MTWGSTLAAVRFTKTELAMRHASRGIQHAHNGKARPRKFVKLDKSRVTLSHRNRDGVDLLWLNVGRVGGVNPKRVLVDGDDCLPICAAVDDVTLEKTNADH